MEATRLVEVEINEGGVVSKQFEEEQFYFRVGLVRDFYIDEELGCIMARLDNGLHRLKYDEDLFNTLKYEINGN